MIVHRNDDTRLRRIPKTEPSDEFDESPYDKHYDSESIYDQIQDDDVGYEKLVAADRCVLI